MTNSSSIPITSPYPSHLGQAPYGLLKLNKCAFGSRKLIPSSSNLLLNSICLLSSSDSIIQVPTPSKKAVSIASASLFKKSSSVLTTTRSTTRNKVYLSLRSSFKASEILKTSSFNLTLE